MFTAKDVMTLRELSGAGMMDCKKALLETDGDMDKAMDLLREKSLTATAKKAARIAAEGIVGSCVLEAEKVAAIVEVNCETDFVAKTDDFKDLVAFVARQIAVKNPADVDALLAQASLDDSAQTVGEKINAAIAKIGEKISVRRFAREEGSVDCYVHLGGKIGVLVKAEGDASRQLLHDVAMHIAAAKPTYLKKEDVDQGEIEHERKILREQALNEPKPKPANIIDRMVDGRIEKYYKDVCLLEQPFVKDTDKAVRDVLCGCRIVSFTRFEMGEGLEKRKDNFAEEVMGQMGK